MNRECSLTVGITGFMLLLWLGSISAQVPSGNDESDGAGNTGGGTAALLGIRSGGTGSQNTAYGAAALALNFSGSDNTAFGFKALERIDFRSASTSTRNTAVGAFGLLVNIGSNNTAGGFAALARNTGDSNTAFGSSALASGVSDEYLQDDPNPTMVRPPFVTGDQNTAIGTSALFNNLSGSNNTGSGFAALFNNLRGSNNTAIGALALIGRTQRSGNNNTAVGFSALSDNGTGDGNTAVGTNALQNNRSGSGNIAIGQSAGHTLQQGVNNIYLGNDVGAETIGETRVMRLGGDQRRTFIAGIITANVSGSTVMINSQGQLGIQSSSARYKRDIQSMGTRSQGLLQLRPVTFHYKHDEQQGERQYGLIAEEVAEVYPELVTGGDEGEVESVRYHALIPMLLNELQQQHAQLGAQSLQLSVLKAENERLWATLAQQQERDEVLAARLERLEAAVAPATLANR